MSFIGAGTALLLCIASSLAGYFFAGCSAYKSQKNRIAKYRQTQSEIELAEKSKEEYRNIARYDGTVQE